MKVLTFNIWNLFGSAHRRERMEAIGDALRQAASDPDGWDVVMLQEMWPCPDRRMFDACGYAHVADLERPMHRMQNWILAPLRLFGFSWIMDSGLRCLSRHPILEARRFDFKTQLPLFARWAHPENYIRKCAVATLIETPDLGRVWVVNTHLIASTTAGTQNRERWHQLEQLRRWMDTKLAGAPIVLGGDLNMGPPVPGSRAAWDEPEFWDEALAGPLAGFSVHDASLQQPTWAGSTNAYVAEDADREDARLDHILAGPGLAIHQAGVTLTSEVDFGGGKRGPLADHYGYEAQITLP